MFSEGVKALFHAEEEYHAAMKVADPSRVAVSALGEMRPSRKKLILVVLVVLIFIAMLLAGDQLVRLFDAWLGP